MECVCSGTLDLDTIEVKVTLVMCPLVDELSQLCACVPSVLSRDLLPCTMLDRRLLVT